MQTLSLDIETYSQQDLSKVGIYKYAENCEVMLVAYAYNDEPVRIVDLAMGEDMPFKLVESLSNPQVVKTAFNAAFELTILEKYLGKELDSYQWQCTMVQAMSLGLPSSLEQVGKVLKLASDKRKLTTGKKLIEYFSKPRKTTVNHVQQPTL